MDSKEPTTVFYVYERGGLYRPARAEDITEIIEAVKPSDQDRTHGPTHTFAVGDRVEWLWRGEHLTGRVTVGPDWIPAGCASPVYVVLCDIRQPAVISHDGVTSETMKHLTYVLRPENPDIGESYEDGGIIRPLTTS